MDEALRKLGYILLKDIAETLRDLNDLMDRKLMTLEEVLKEIEED